MEKSAAKIERIKRAIRFEVLGTILTQREIAELEGISIHAVRRFKTRYNIEIKRQPYRVSEKVYEARRKRVKKLKEIYAENRRQQKMGMDEKERQRIANMKNLAANDILCQRWISC